MAVAGTTQPVNGFLGTLDSAHDLAALLSAVQLREKESKIQRLHCEASERGLKFVAQSMAKDVAVLAWMFSEAFREYRYTGPNEELNIQLPVAPLLSCLQIFSDRASLQMRYPAPAPDGSEEDSGEVHLTLEEDGAVTECRLHTFFFEDNAGPPPLGAFFTPGDSKLSTFRVLQHEVWAQALGEFVELDAPDVTLQITLANRSAAVGSDTDATSGPIVVLRAQTLTNDVEVELPHRALPELQLPNEREVSHSYLLSSVLAGCLRAAREAKAVKVRFNAEGVMSNQFILRGRGSRDLFCEALITPLAVPVSAFVGGLHSGSAEDSGF